MADVGRRLLSSVGGRVFWTFVKRYPLYRRAAEFRRRQWDSPGEFAGRQRALMTELLGHAVERVPFYRGRVTGLAPGAIADDPLAALERFPVLTRSDVADHRKQLTCELGRRTYLNSTGGSTGVPVQFYQDAVYQTANLASISLMYEWAGMKPGDRHVKLWGAARDTGGLRRSVRARLADFIDNRVTLDAFRLDDDSMQAYVALIDRLRPVCVEGYAEALHEIALFMEREGLEVRSPACVVSSASTLYPHVRERVEGTFGARVFDRYGTREAGALACECDQHAGLHVFGETSYIEVADEEGKPVGVGEEGDILVTNLWNHTMPLIRYRIGDRAVRGETKCDCGRPYPLLERIVGRSDSCVALPDGRVIIPEFFIHLIGVEHNDGSIRKFQVVYEHPCRFVVRVVRRGEPVDEEWVKAKSSIASRIRTQAGGDCSISFEEPDEIEPTSTGKHLYVVSRNQSS